MFFKLYMFWCYINIEFNFLKSEVVILKYV